MNISHIVYQSSGNGHFGSFHFGAVINMDAMNTHVQVLEWTYVFYSVRYTHMREIAGSCGNYV